MNSLMSISSGFQNIGLGIETKTIWLAIRLILESGGIYFIFRINWAI